MCEHSLRRCCPCGAGQARWADQRGERALPCASSGAASPDAYVGVNPPAGQPAFPETHNGLCQNLPGATSGSDKQVTEPAGLCHSGQQGRGRLATGANTALPCHRAVMSGPDRHYHRGASWDHLNSRTAGRAGSFGKAPHKVESSLRIPS